MGVCYNDLAIENTLEKPDFFIESYYGDCTEQIKGGSLNVPTL
jgi:hypothetical protein